MNVNTKKILKLNFDLINKERKNVFINFCVWLLINCIPLLMGILISKVLDNLYDGNKHVHIQICVVLCVIAMIYSLIIIFGGWIDTLTKFNIRGRIRKNLILNVIFKKKNNASSGEFIEIMTNDVSSFEELISCEIDLLCKMIFAIVAIGYLLKISVKITLFAIIPIIFVNKIVRKFGEKVKNNYFNSRKTSLDYSDFLDDVLSNRQIIQFMGKKEYIIKRLEKLCIERKRHSVVHEVFSKLLIEITDFANILSIVILLIVTFYEMRNGNFTVGTLSLYIYLAAYINDYNGLFTEAYCSIKYCETALERINDILFDISDSNYKMLLENVDLYDEKKNNSEIEVDISFGKGRINFQIKDNKLVVVCGDNGSGKSRLIDALVGYSDYEGSIYASGEKIPYISNVSIVQQQPVFLDENIYENINYEVLDDRNTRFFAQLRGNWQDRCIDIMKKLNLYQELKDKITNYSNIGINGKLLSEGQRQRLAIARALVNTDDLLILDDCLSLIDNRNKERVINLLNAIDKNIILVSNDRDVLKNADLILIMKENKMVYRGEYFEGLYDEILKEV